MEGVNWEKEWGGCAGENRGRVEVSNKGGLESPEGKNISMTCKRDVKENKEMLWVLISGKINFFGGQKKNNNNNKNKNKPKKRQQTCLSRIAVH